MSRARPPPNKRLAPSEALQTTPKETNPNDRSPLVGRRIGKVLLRRFDGYHDMPRWPATVIAKPRRMLDPVTISASTRMFCVTRDTARIGSRDQYTSQSLCAQWPFHKLPALVCCDVKCSMGGLPKSQLALSWTSRLVQTARPVTGCSSIAIPWCTMLTQQIESNLQDPSSQTNKSKLSKTACRTR